MRNQMLIATAAALIATAGLAGAPQTVVDTGRIFLQGPGPYDWECDTDSAYRRIAYTPAVSDHLRVTGVMHVLRMHENRFDEWGATVTVAVDDKGANERGVAFQLMVMTKKSDAITLALRDYSHSMITMASQPNKESEIPFMVTLDKGIVSVTAASSGLVGSDGAPQRFSATLTKPRSDLGRVALSCSGAHVRFSNVTVTTDAAASP